ncbi:MAG: YihA family ribosome biogenesis GTP-binding protein, partial [Clostridia bacterium]|nr:YihA family ribosome biogenesis GTP-binding protein [Clostridia bacterium]
MIIKNAQFVISVAAPDKLLDEAKEIAVVGRSNVGKSS